MEAQLQELLPFLHDKSGNVRQIALSNLVGHTSKESQYRTVFVEGIQSGGLKSTTSNTVIKDLKLLCRDQLGPHDAFKALVNLSDIPSVISAVSDEPFLIFLVSYIIYPPSILADLASMLLSNLTTRHETCRTILDMSIDIIPHAASNPPFYPPQCHSATSPSPSIPSSIERRSVPALPLLIQAFTQAPARSKGEGHELDRRKADLHFLASVFTNISTIPKGATFFLTPHPSDPLQPNTESWEYPLSQLAAFTEHQDTIRRGGVTSTIKNCAFHLQGHRALLLSDTESVAVPPSNTKAPGINVLPYILLPLAGPEEFDLEDQENLLPELQFLPDTKKREADPAVRLMHVETLLLLCSSRWGRDYLRSHGVYEVVKAMHLAETDDKIAEHVERLVNFLKRDEGTGIDTYEVDENAGETMARELQGQTSEGRLSVDVIPPSSSLKTADDSDDDDDKIVVV